MEFQAHSIGFLSKDWIDILKLYLSPTAMVKWHHNYQHTAAGWLQQQQQKKWNRERGQQKGTGLESDGARQQQDQTSMDQPR